ncbi:uncharacterized protein V6R79_016183 [Siganus canaliculatus]
MVDKAGLLLLLWAGVTASTVVDLHKRIIGGRKCHKDERLYHVRLTADTDPDYLCGGSLISNEWVLTAAHCLEEGTMYAEVGVHPGPGEKVNVLENHTCCNNNEKHDLMLLKLDMSELGESFPKIDPVRKPQCNPGTVKIAGHAATTGGPNDERLPDSSRTLQCADIDIVDCQRFINVVGGIDPNTLGDSGGGVVFNGMIYGVIVRLHPPYVCREAAAFMDLCHPDYAAWIRDTAVPDWPV